MRMTRSGLRSMPQPAKFESLLKPADAAAAKEALLTLIERVTKPLEAKAEVYRERSRIKNSLAADLLAFDPSVEAERLRRHELATGRAMARSLDTLFKLRRVDPSRVSRQSSVVSCEAEAMPGSVRPSRTHRPRRKRDERTHRPRRKRAERTHRAVGKRAERSHRWLGKRAERSHRWLGRWRRKRSHRGGRKMPERTHRGAGGKCIERTHRRPR